MAESIATFQSQLSGVMETVFKAAIYEITRLVEDSFLEEMTRSKEQVDALKRRLKWAEGRRKERETDRRGKCVDCGRDGVPEGETPRTTGKGLKQDKAQKEKTNRSQSSDVESSDHDNEEAKPEMDSVMKATQTPIEQEGKVDRLLKEEALQVASEASESQERWRVQLGETDTSGLPGPSKRYNDQRIPKSHANWEAGFEQRPESSQHVQSGDQSQPLFHNRYSGMEDLTDFDKASYEDTSMIPTLGGLQASPSHLGEDLNYMGHYEGHVEPPEGAEHQPYQTSMTRSRRGMARSSAGSPSRTNINVSGEFSCLLINEEGYLQDPSILYPEQMTSDSGGKLRCQGMRTDQTFSSTEDMYEDSGTYGDPLILGERLHHQAFGRGGRRVSCNICSMSFPDPASLKAHKQSHKGASQGPPYCCTQCGKTFTQAGNFKVHQRTHCGQGLHLCSHCGKGFPSFAELKTHACGQRGDKPYCCSVCGNKFSRLWNLKLHRRIHTQEKPHRCNMCDKSFTRADILKVHQRTHTGERPYCCAVCGLSFKRLDHLKSHQRKHISDL